MQQGKSDIGWADLFLVPDRMKFIDYTGGDSTGVQEIVTPLIQLHTWWNMPASCWVKSQYINININIDIKSHKLID